MNPTEILEILLGGKRGAADDETSGKSPSEAAPRPRSSMPSEDDVSRQARELEEMTGIGRGGHSGQPGTPAQPSGGRPTIQPPPASSRKAEQTSPWQIPAPGSIPQRLPDDPSEAPVRKENEATVLIRTMIMAAKADGRLTPQEQRALIQRIGNSSPEAIRFLQSELDRVVSVRDFTWSVPIGMEAKVYMMSRSALTSQSAEDAAYLDELAHGLRLPPEVRQYLDQRAGLQGMPP